MSKTVKAMTKAEVSQEMQAVEDRRALFMERYGLVETRQSYTSVVKRFSGRPVKETDIYQYPETFRQFFDHVCTWRRPPGRYPVLLTSEPYLAFSQEEIESLTLLCDTYSLDFEIGFDAIWNPPWTTMIKLYPKGKRQEWAEKGGFVHRR